jgi:hypothetical protein
LADHGFNFFTMFVPDLLHEVELGGVKSLFAHLVRILYAYDGDSVTELDKRYTFCVTHARHSHALNRFFKIPKFGRGTIRRFHANASEMKKLAARDFEDILQVLMVLILTVLVV